MSLINEALKKAQHQRSGPPTDLPPMPGTAGGSPAARRGRSLPARTVALIAGGAAAAIVVAVLVTLALVRREPAPSTPPSRAAVTPAPVVPSPAPAPAKVAADAPAAASPVIVAPVITVPSTSPTPAVETPAPKPAPVVPVATVTPPPAPATPGPAPAPAAQTLAGSGQDIRILTLIDSLRVTGIRSSGTDSKVLMNDRVYRINDVVDYALGLRLTKVGADGLTFTDPSGTTYVKNF